MKKIIIDICGYKIHTTQQWKDDFEKAMNLYGFVNGQVEKAEIYKGLWEACETEEIRYKGLWEACNPLASIILKING